MPNNRQWAFMFWIVVLLGWMLVRKDTRLSIGDAFRVASSPRIFVPVAILVAWVVGLVWAASRINLWDGDRITDTVFWFITAGLVLFGRLDKVRKEPHFVRRSALATLELSALVEVLSELFVLNLVTELILQPVFALVGGMSVVAAQKSEYRRVKRLVDGLIVAASLAILMYAIVNLITNWNGLDKGDLLQQFTLPVWLTVGVLPYIYLLGLVAAYELAFIRIDWKSEFGWLARARAKLILLASFHIRARGIGAFSGPWQHKLAAATSFREGRRVVRDFRQATLETRRTEQEEAARLSTYAGVDGVDEEGRRLDRREFATTKKALRWVATCQMGWYNNNRSGRYRSDLLDFVLEGLGSQGLPQPHNVRMEVSPDGQKWFAWRRTVSGWVFAIGAAGPPPDQWEYDGSEVPRGFPGEDPAWGDQPFGDGMNVNWSS